MTKERAETIETLRDQAKKAGEDTPLGKIFTGMADRFGDRPASPTRTAPVHRHAPHVAPEAAPAGIERSLPTGDREDVAEPGSEG